MLERRTLWRFHTVHILLEGDELFCLDLNLRGHSLAEIGARATQMCQDATVVLPAAPTEEWNRFASAPFDHVEPCRWKGLRVVRAVFRRVAL